MVELLFIGGAIAIVAAIVIALIALRSLLQKLDRLQVEQKAWERAQEIHQQTWLAEQEKRAAEFEKQLVTQIEQQEQRAREFEKQLATQMEQLRSEWKMKQQEQAEALIQQAETLTRQYEAVARQSRIEYELARLPRVEDMPLAVIEKGPYDNSDPRWQPAKLQGADLRGYDLSHRYLARADLRQAQLQKAKLFMADLTGASLADADLSEADLTTANLTGADLRGATLVGTNFLLTDLNNANLVGVNLLQVRNLSAEQIVTAAYDSTTQLVVDINPMWLRTPNTAIHRPEPPSSVPEPIVAQPAIEILDDKEVIDAFSSEQEDIPPILPVPTSPTPESKAPPEPTTTQPVEEGIESTTDSEETYSDFSILFEE